MARMMTRFAGPPQYDETADQRVILRTKTTDSG